MGVDDDVGEADDDVPLQLKRRTIAAENDGKDRVANHRVVQALAPVVGYK